ncbi:hypothetical protein Tco_0410091 [Tanacetum coccineum]
MTPAQQREYMRVFVKNQSTTIYSTGWSMKYVKSLADEQLRAEFEKIRMAVADLKSNELRRTLKRAGEALEPDISKKKKSTESPIPSVPDVPQPQGVSSSKSSGTRRKSLGRSRMTKPELDLDADDKTFIKVVSDEDSEDEAPILWSAFTGWEVISTPLGEINALYIMDQSTKHFTTLREILYMVDRHDLLKLYGLVVKYYENHPVTGAGLMIWGDLQISSWRLYTLSNVHVLKTVSGEVLYMFADVSYPLSVKHMERMLKHKLEIAKDVVGNDMTTSVVSTFVHKVNSLETELKAHKQLFKDVVGKLVKKVKAMEVKLKPKKRKVVVSDSDQDKGGEQAVDLDALIALANATVTVDSNIPFGGPSNDTTASSHIPTGVPTDGNFSPAHSTSPSRDPFKGKGVAEPSSPVSKRTKKQLADERLSEIEAARLEALERERSEKEKAEIARQDAIYAKQLEQEEEMSASQRETRQAEVLSSAKHYSNADWIDIMAQVHANAVSLTFSEAGVLHVNWTSFGHCVSCRERRSDDNLWDMRLRFVDGSFLFTALGEKRELDLDADDKTFIKVVSDEDSEDEAPILWSAFAGWEVISTPLGEINALYMMDQSTKHFTTLREILHMVDRHDLLKLYGLVVKYYEDHPVTGAGLMLWGDLQVLMDSQAGGKGSFVWNHQSLWQIRSWRLYTLSNVHVLETISGEVLYMFADVSYPLSVKLMERTLKHKLEIAKDVVGNDMTTAEQLIQFIKNQLAAAQVSPA